MKYHRLEENKELAIEIITCTIYDKISYKFLFNNTIYTGRITNKQLTLYRKNQKKLVVFNSLNPNENFMLVKYPIDSDFKLGDSLDTIFNKDSIHVPFWKLSLGLTRY